MATPLQIDVLTLFPRMIQGYVSESILGKAQERGLLRVRAIDIRAFATDKHHVTDDTPYGGGAGMVMKIDPLIAALEASKAELVDAAVYLMSPRGKTFSQPMAHAFAEATRDLILICGRYEGVDERVNHFIDGCLSLGDFVLTGGELAALAVIDAVARLRDGVLGNQASSRSESFESGLLEYPQYTRPAEFRGLTVPAVLQSGDHAKIDKWRRTESLRLTLEHRPDLLEKTELSESDKKALTLLKDAANATGPT